MQYRFYMQAYETLVKADCDYGDTINAFNKRINKSGVCPTLTTRPEGFKTAILIVTEDKRLRKLTEKECFRLMGVRDEDYEKISKHQTKTSLYHLSGDSIVTSVMCAVLIKILKLNL